MRATADDGIHRTKEVAVEVAAGAEARVDLAFNAPAFVHGHVTRGGVPLSGGAVRFDYAEAVVGPDGTYSLKIDSGEYDVRISEGSRSLPFRGHVTITGDVEASFSVGVATVSVRVVDEAGQPLAGAAVTAAPHGLTHESAEATTGKDGVAVVEVAGGEETTITGVLRGFANASQDVTASGSSSITLRLLRSNGAIVHIVDARDGRTLGGYIIARDASGRVIASADEPETDGTMTLAVPPGTYRFSASAENYGSHTIKAEVSSNEIRVPLPRAGSLALRSNHDMKAKARLIQPDGEEYVRCWCSGLASIALDGRYVLVDQIAPGAYTLEVTPEGGRAKTFAVTVLEGTTTSIVVE